MAEDSSRLQSVEGPTEYAFPKTNNAEHALDSQTIPRMKTTSRSARRSLKSDERKRKARVDCAAQGLVKRLGKNDQLPPIVSPYPSESRKGDPLPNLEYCLSTDEQKLLDKFWEKFQPG